MKRIYTIFLVAALMGAQGVWAQDINIGTNNTSGTNWARDADGVYRIWGDVNVTGTRTGTNVSFTFTNTSASNVTITWTANLTGINGLTGNFVTIGSTGAGRATLNVGNGGTITTAGTDNHAITSNSNVIVSGGTVSTSGTGSNAINTPGTVTVSGGRVATNGTSSIAIITTADVAISGTAEVNAAGSQNNAIQTTGNVTVTGGTVTGNLHAINATGASSRVDISGGRVSNQSDQSAIRTLGANSAVNVSQPSATTTLVTTLIGTAINSNGTVTVQGGTVSATADEGNAIVSAGNVTVNGGTVSVTTQTAINISGANRTVTVSGTGTVRATGNDGTAINNNGTVNVSGGTVTASGNTGVAIRNNGTVNVSGGTVSATGNDGVAISVGTNTVTVTGGTVSATTGTGIFAGRVDVSGNGTIVSSTTGRAIDATGVVTVNVSGTGAVRATGSSGIAIRSTNNITVNGGTVSASSGTAISATGTGRTVSINGATVQISPSNTGISLSGTSNTVNVTNGTVSGSTAILATGQNSMVNINGGTVSGSWETIYVNGHNSVVNVRDGTVSSSNYHAINAFASSNNSTTPVNITINVENTGVVRATSNSASNYAAIYSYTHNGNVTINVRGGTVETTAINGRSISIGAPTSGTTTGGTTVDISGGTVRAIDNAAIFIQNTIISANSPITVRGNAMVIATGSGTAISATSGIGNITVSGGTVRANTGAAINVGTTTRTVAVSGGLVFAYGSAVTNIGNATTPLNVIVGGGFTEASGTGVVLAWHHDQNTVYCLNSSTDLRTSRTSETAVWNCNGGGTGCVGNIGGGAIRYANGANTGYIEINTVRLVSADAIPTAADFSFLDDINSGDYNCEEHPVTIVHNSSIEHPVSSLYPSWAQVLYNGSLLPEPVDAGTYNITINVLRVPAAGAPANWSAYCPANNVAIGSYTIIPRKLFVVADRVDMREGVTPTHAILNPSNSVNYKFYDEDDNEVLIDDFCSLVDVDDLKNHIEVYINDNGPDVATLPVSVAPYSDRVGVRIKSGAQNPVNYLLEFISGDLYVRSETDIENYIFVRFEITTTDEDGNEIITTDTRIAEREGDSNHFVLSFVDAFCNMNPAKIEVLPVYPENTNVTISRSDIVENPNSVELEWNLHNSFDINVSTLNNSSRSDYTLTIIRNSRPTEFLVEFDEIYDGLSKDLRFQPPGSPVALPAIYVDITDPDAEPKEVYPVNVGEYSVAIDVGDKCYVTMGVLKISPRSLVVTVRDFEELPCTKDADPLIPYDPLHYIIRKMEEDNIERWYDISGFLGFDGADESMIIEYPEIFVIDGFDEANFSMSGVHPDILDAKGGETNNPNYTFGIFVPASVTVVCDDIVQVTLLKNIDEAGELTGGGPAIVNHTSMRIEVIDVIVGYNFMGWSWTDDEADIFTDGHFYNFIPSDDVTIWAIFEINTYTIAVSANPEDDNIVSGGGAYQHDEEVTVTATAGVGYDFVNWTEDGNEVSTDVNYKFTVIEPRTLVANFVLKIYEIEVVANPLEGGVVTGGDTYTHGDIVTVTAAPNTGYQFEGWTITKADGSEEISTEATMSFFASEDLIFLANFALKTYNITLSVNLVDAGKITMPDGTVTTGFIDIPHFTQRTVNAVPEEGYYFINWTELIDGDIVPVSSQNPYIITAEREQSLVANFAKQTFIISSSVLIGQGTIDPIGDVIVEYDGVQTFEIMPANGWEILELRINGTPTPTASTAEASYTFSNVLNNSQSIQVDFIRKKYLITASPNEVEYGSVTGGGEFNHDDEVVLTATALHGYNFLNWTENDAIVSTDATYKFSAAGNRGLIANFSAETYTITVLSSPAGSGILTGGGVYEHDAQVVLTASPQTGYQFLNWILTGGGVVSSNETAALTATETITYIAVFVPKTYDIILTANPADGGTVSGGGTDLPHFSQRTVSATPADGYNFVNWTENGVVVHDDPVYQFTVNDGRVLVANFAKQSFTITPSIVIGMGSITPDTPVNIEYGGFQTFGIIPDDGWEIWEVIIDGTPTIPQSTYTFSNVTAHHSIVVNFRLKTVNVMLTSNPNDGGVLTGGGDYTLNSNISVFATANTGYNFVNWTENGDEIYFAASYTFLANASRTLVANFVLKNYDIAVSASPSAGGSVSDGNTYKHGDNVTVSATPAMGYNFVNWAITTTSGSSVSTNPTISFSASEDIAYVANFELKTYDIFVSANLPAGGTVSSNRMGITHFSETTVEATPTLGYDFVNWTENGVVVHTEAVYQFTVDRGRVLVANFEIQKFIITPSVAVGMGSITPNDAVIVDYGGFQTFGIKADDGWEIMEVIVDGVLLPDENISAYTFSDVTTPHSIVANFRIESFEISVLAIPEHGGDATGAGTYTRGDHVTVSALTNPGYTFVNWTLNNDEVATISAYTFPSSQNAILTAHFAPIITVSVEPVSGGEVLGIEEDLRYRSNINLLATPNFGYDFVNWTEDDVVISTNPALPFMATVPRNLVANFKLKTYNIALSASPPTGGTVLGGGIYTHGDEVNVIATPAYGYDFVNWTENGVDVSADEFYTFTALEERNLVANFELKVYDIAILINPTGGGAVSGSGRYTHGDEVTVTAIPPPGCNNFINWTIGETIVSTSLSFSFTAIEDVTITANFRAIEFDHYAVVLWDNTFMLNLRKLAEEGYGVHGCTWLIQENEVWIEQADTRTINEYSYSAGPGNNDFLKSAVYMFRLETSRGSLCSTEKTIVNNLVSSFFDDNENDDALFAYPNPLRSGSQLTIEGVAEGSRLDIYNQSGILVRSVVSHNSVVTLNLSLPPGVYVVRNGDRATKIIIEN